MVKLIGGARGGKSIALEEEHGGALSLRTLEANAPEGYRPVTLTVRGAYGAVSETRAYVSNAIKLPAVLPLLLDEHGAE